MSSYSRLPNPCLSTHVFLIRVFLSMSPYPYPLAHFSVYFNSEYESTLRTAYFETFSSILLLFWLFYHPLFSFLSVSFGNIFRKPGKRQPFRQGHCTVTKSFRWPLAGKMGRIPGTYHKAFGVYIMVPNE